MHPNKDRPKRGNRPLRVEIRDLQDQPFDGDLLTRVAVAASEAETADLDCFSIVVVDNHTMQRLNRELLNADRPTDVIAFEAEAGPDGQTEAEAYISLEQAALQAAERGHTVEWELAFLVAHAILHAIGYSDSDEETKQMMLDKQTAIMKQFEEHARSVQH